MAKQKKTNQRLVPPVPVEAALWVLCHEKSGGFFIDLQEIP